MTDDFVKKAGFNELSTIKKGGDCEAASAIRNKKRYFIKWATNESGKKQIEREFINQKFLRKLSEEQDIGFSFLQPKLELGILIYPELKEGVTWFSKSNPEAVNFRPKVLPLKNYLNQIVIFEKVIQKIKFDNLPIFIKKDWQARRKDISKNFNNNLNYLQEKKLISINNARKINSCFFNYYDNWAYQHHDVLPWHIVKRNQNNRLILVDAGWAGWSFQYYDIAYYILQMVGYANRPHDSIKFLNTMKKEFYSDKEFSDKLKAAISYRFIKLVKELYENQSSPSQAKKVIKFVDNLKV